MTVAAVAALRRCAHCGLPVRSDGGNAEIFCCAGCRIVSRLMGSRGGEGRPAWALFRVGVAAILSMEVMMISILLYLGEVEPETALRFRWFLLALSAPVMILVTAPFLRGGWREILRGRPGLELLIAAGSSAAFLASAFNTFSGRGALYYDTATMLPVLVGAGKILEGRAKRRAGDLLRVLDDLLPASALVMTSGGDVETATRELRPGDAVRVAAGSRIPVDGVVVEGETAVVEAAFTGEPLPRQVRPGDPVLAGTVAGNGSIVVLAERTAGETLVSRIGRMTADAAARPPSAERLAESVGSLLVPGTMVLAVAAGLYHAFTSGAAAGGMAALAVLVVSCPCSMGIAAPLATAAAVGRAARAGIVVRGGDVLENAGAVTVVCLDKTGTVTEPVPRLRRVETLTEDSSRDDILAWLAPLEVGLPHPIARAVVDSARERGEISGRAAGVKLFPGGVSGAVTIGGETRSVVAGTEESVTGIAGTEPGCIVVALDGKPQARLHFTDSIRKEAREAVAELRRMEIRTVLLSGDGEEATERVALKSGIDAFVFRSLPEGKTEFVNEGTARGERMAMAGDGVNDGPALAAAEVGIAMGGGADLARCAGNVILLGEDLRHIPWLIGLGRASRRIIMQNLAWGIGYNAVALTAAAAGYLHPLLAAVAMALSSVTVLGNSLRLSRFPGPEGEGT
jgi:heavy metal translocating P-type ATPase